MATNGLDLLLAPQQAASGPQNGLDLLLAPQSQMPAPQPVQKPRSGWESLGRQIELTGRAGLQGLVALPGMVADAATGVYNTGADLVQGKGNGYRFAPTSYVLGNLLTKAGLAAPESAQERVVQDAASAVGGVGTSAKLGQFLAKNSAPVVAAVGRSLQANLGNQGIAAGSAGTAAGVTRENGGGPVAQIAAALGAGLAGSVGAASAVPAANKLAAAVKNAPIVNPTGYAGRQISAQLGPDAAAVTDSLANAREIVPGSRPTSAQAAADPRLVMIEKALSNASPEFKTKAMTLENQNNAARLAQVGEVAGDPGKLDFYRADRAAAAQQNYGQAFSADAAANLTPAVKGQITQLMKRPAMQDAMKAAKVRAQNLGLPLDDTSSVQGLHFAKMELDSAINQAKRSGADIAGLEATRTKLLGVIENLSPDYANARATYAAQSQPINAMEIGTQLQDKLGNLSLNSAGTPQVPFTGYRNSLAQALRGSKYGVDAESLAKLQAVQDDLQRATISNSVRMPGSDTAFNQGAGKTFLRALGADDSGGLGQMATAGGATYALTGSKAAAGGMAALVQKLGSLSTSRVQNAMGDLMLDPKKLAEALKAAKKVDPALPQQIISRLGMNPTAALPYGQPAQVPQSVYSLTTP